MLTHLRCCPGVSSEVFYHGPLYPWTWLLSASLSQVLFPNLFLPVYHKMHLTSVYEYLEMRYNSRLVRRLCSLTFIAGLGLTSSVVLYTPCLCLEMVTGSPAWIFVLAAGLILILITSLAGLRAVVWSSVWQVVIMLLSLCCHHYVVFIMLSSRPP